MTLYKQIMEMLQQTYTIDMKFQAPYLASELLQMTIGALGSN